MQQAETHIPTDMHAYTQTAELRLFSLWVLFLQAQNHKQRVSDSHNTSFLYRFATVAASAAAPEARSHWYNRRADGTHSYTFCVPYRDIGIQMHSLLYKLLLFDRWWGFSASKTMQEVAWCHRFIPDMRCGAVFNLLVYISSNKTSPETFVKIH